MTSIKDVIRRLNSEDCEVETASCLCLESYELRDCWACILEEYTNEVYNKALEDFKKEIINWKPSDEKYRIFTDVVEEIEEKLRKV